MPKIYIFFLATPFKTGRAIRLLTHRPYNHVAVSFTPKGERLFSYMRYRYHEPLISGFGEEFTDRYADVARQVGLRVCEVELSQAHYQRVRRAVDAYLAAQQDTCYSFVDLLAYPFHRHVQLAYTHTCISFVCELLELPRLYTIGQLEKKLARHTLYKGPMAGYYAEFSHGPQDFYERRSRRVVYSQSARALCHQAHQLAQLCWQHFA